MSSFRFSLPTFHSLYARLTVWVMLTVMTVTIITALIVSYITHFPLPLRQTYRLGDAYGDDCYNYYRIDCVVYQFVGCSVGNERKRAKPHGDS